MILVVSYFWREVASYSGFVSYLSPEKPVLFTTLEDVWRRSRRVLGDSHPDTERAREFLEEVRSARADAAEES